VTTDDLLKDLSPEERTQLDEIVKKIDETIAKGKIHPVVKDVIFLLHDENATWFNSFPLERLQTLQAVIVGSDRILDAVYDLFRLCAVLWEVPPAKHASMVLYKLLEKIVEEKNLMASLKRDAEFTSGRLDMAKHTIGDESTASAPKLGEAPPEGSVKAEKLIPKRRI
jgi:hypothetical protein